MESADLISPDPADRELEGLLRQRPLPLADDGFTQRVLTALPSREPASAVSSYARRIFVLVGAAIGIALVAANVESFAALRADLTPVAEGLQQATSAFADPRVVTTLVIAGVSTLYAFLSATPRRL